MADTETPIVAKVHWDDVLGHFSLKITFQLDGPTGNFHREIKLTAADLATALADIVTAWTGGGAMMTVTPGFPVGDMAALRAMLSARFP